MFAVKTAIRNSARLIDEAGSVKKLITSRRTVPPATHAAIVRSRKTARRHSRENSTRLFPPKEA
jgi:hypothetical protein